MTAAAVSSELETILGRPVWPIDVGEPLRTLSGSRILVTGAAGSIGEALVAALTDVVGDDQVTATDIDTLDVRFPETVRPVMQQVRPDVVFHLAGAKHAPEGETDPYQVALTNTEGTWNVVRQAQLAGCGRVILASTCKSCDPETVYGASKLIAERMVLNAGGSVARFYNVVETSGNVFETWRGLADDEPVPATDCERYFIALDEAIALLLWAAVLPAGRYAVSPANCRLMTSLAAALYPDREIVAMPPRRGDRGSEPLIGSSEQLEWVSEWLLRVTSPHEVAA